MSKFIIEGGRPLSGEITIAGNKNAALPIIAATVLTDEICRLENMPHIRDVDAMLETLKTLGKAVEWQNPNRVIISGAVKHFKPDEKLVSRLRASILYLGALLARHGAAELAPPGGCVIGRRGVESHFEALRAMGARIEVTEEHYIASVERTRPARIFLSECSVTATENAMLLAAAVEGETTIENAAAEPHVADLADVLVKMGAEISGAGTNRLCISGAAKLQGFTHRIVPDHIEVGTFAIAAACTRGDILMHDIRPEHLRMTKHYLARTGIDLEYAKVGDAIVKYGELTVPSRKIQVGVWPGFPTDLMSPMIVLATQTEGTTLCHDWMYESRMFFIDKLIAMGARITLCDPHRVLVSGPTALRGQQLSSPDIRAGIALVIAALAAKGVSTIANAELVDRGYENIVDRLRALGAKIERAD